MTQRKRKPGVRITVTMLGEPRDASRRAWDIKLSTGLYLHPSLFRIPTLKYMIEVPSRSVRKTVRTLMATGHIASCEPVSAPPQPQSTKPRRPKKTPAPEKLVMIQICMRENNLVNNYGGYEGNAHDLMQRFGIRIMADGPERPPTVYYETEVPESKAADTITKIQSMPYVHGAFIKSTREAPPAPPPAPKTVKIHITVTGPEPDGQAYRLEQTFGIKLWANGPERPPTHDFTTDVVEADVEATLAKLRSSPIVKLAYALVASPTPELK